VNSAFFHSSKAVVSVIFLACAAIVTPLQADLEMGTEDREIQLKVAKSKRTKVAGGDYDDKLERISLNIRIKNRSLRDAKEGLTARYWIIGESMVHRSALEVLDSGEMKVDLGSEFGKREFKKETNETVVQWDDTNLVHGAKYDGWIFVLLDADGKVIKSDASKNTFRKLIPKADFLKKGNFYDSNFDIMSVPKD